MDFDHPGTTPRPGRRPRFDDEDDDLRLLSGRHRRRPTPPDPDRRPGPVADRSSPDDRPDVTRSADTGRSAHVGRSADTDRFTDADPFADDDGADPDDDGSGWSTWPDAVHGPHPRPDWVVTEAAARDTDLGVLKTGKEADVHLVRREVPGTGRSTLLAAKRYRDPRHRMFHRDAAYTEGRRVRRSRETRAMARRTSFGRDLLAGQWASAEFAALGRLWQLGRAGGIRVPYPVQLHGTELLLEFVGDADGTAAPRLAQLRPDPDTLVGYWHQVVESLGTLAGAGLAHGDLSPYNVLAHDGRLVLIDLPQVVDLVANPRGPAFLARDVRVMTDWFLARGLDPDRADAARLTGELLADAGLPPDAAEPI